MKFLQFASEIEVTDEEQQWWDALVPHFRRRLIAGAALKATLGTAVILSYQWFTGDRHLAPGYVVSIATLLYGAFGLLAIKVDLPLKRDQSIKARRIEQAVLAEPDQLAELPSRAAAPRRFQ